MSVLKDIRRWKWTDRGFLELDDNGNLCEWDDVKRILEDKDKEIADLKAQKAQAEDDCAYWKTLAQKKETNNDDD